MNMPRSGPAVLMLLTLAACEATGPVPTQFQANLAGTAEVPAVTTTATGTATITVSGTTLQYAITVANLVNPTVAHIHVGAVGVAGGVRFDLCGTGGAIPACAAGTVTGALVTNTAGHGVVQAGLSFDSLRILMGNFGAYVNVHTAANPGGELRGQIFARN